MTIGYLVSLYFACCIIACLIWWAGIEIRKKIKRVNFIKRAERHFNDYLYCDCCGEPKAIILANLRELSVVKNKQDDGKHFRYVKTPIGYEDEFNFFAHRNTVKYCEVCGEELRDDDFHTSRELMGECHGAPAYEIFIVSVTCSNCGTTIEY